MQRALHRDLRRVSQRLAVDRGRADDGISALDGDADEGRIALGAPATTLTRTGRPTL